MDATSSPTTTVIGGAPNNPSAFHVPSRALQHRVPRCCQRGEVGHGRAGHESAARSGWQPEHVQQPAQRNFFQHGPDRRGGEQAGRWSQRRPASSPPAPPAASRRSRIRRIARPAIPMVAGEPMRSSISRTGWGSSDVRAKARSTPRDAPAPPRWRDATFLQIFQVARGYLRRLVQQVPHPFDASNPRAQNEGTFREFLRLSKTNKEGPRERSS